MKPNISRDALLSFLASRYSRLEGLVQLAEGEESQAFVARADSHEIVVRINASRAGFEKDRMAAEHWPSTRAPAVFAIEPIADTWVCISKRVAGSTLQTLGNDAISYGHEVCVALDAIAACDVSFITGYGPFSAEGRGAFHSWQQFVTSVDGPRDLVTLVREYNYGDPRALVHGDFGSNNVLVANGTVTGVVDWSEAAVGDPLYDVANLFFWRPWLKCMEAQCRYFESIKPGRLADKALLIRYQLRIGLQILAEAKRNHDDNMANWALLRCRKIASS